jgi:hypothetical protein
MSTLFDVPRGYVGEPLVQVKPYLPTGSKQRQDNSYEALVATIDHNVRREEDGYQAPKPRVRQSGNRLPTKQPRVGGPKPR